METSSSTPPNKKEFITEIGKILVNEHGKKKYYKPEEVKKANKQSKWYNNTIDFHCWAMCTFSSHSDFDRYHSQTGEVCDYVEMKTEMLGGISNGTETISNWSDIPDIDLDASWLDFGDMFEGVIEGIGDLISGILD